jgi:hypothetical protein
MQAAIWLYPWDLLDEGVRPLLEKLAGMGYSAVHLAASYHSLQAFLPHNPRRRTILAERSAVYFRPNPAVWQGSTLTSRVSPIVDDLGDALAAAGEICRDVGLGLVAWTVCLHNGDLGLRYPAVNVVNMFGEPYRNSVCPANPDVRDYLLRLVADLRTRCDAIEIEAPHWMSFPHHQHAKTGVTLDAVSRLLLSLCFCDHCRLMGAAAGVDVGALLDRLQARLPGNRATARAGSDEAQVASLVAGMPDLGRFLEARAESIGGLISSIARTSAPRPVYLMTVGPAWLSGADRGRLAPLVDRVEVLAYGSPGEVAATARSATTEVTRLDRLAIGLSLLEPETPDEASFRAACDAVAKLGIERLILYNYGLTDAPRVAWVTAALDAGPARTPAS